MPGAKATVRMSPTVRFESVSPLGVGVAVVCPIALAVAAGLVGGIVGTVGLGIWLVSPVYAFAIAQLGLLLVVPDSISIGELVILESGLGTLLFAGMLDEFESRRSIGVFLLGAVGLGGTAVAAGPSAIALWQSVLAVLGVFAFLSYGLHRYELVELGLVEEQDR